MEIEIEFRLWQLAELHRSHFGSGSSSLINIDEANLRLHSILIKKGKCCSF